METKRRILRALYEEGQPHVTPGFLVYRLGIDTKAADALLLEMTSEGLIELDSDGDGNLFYRLPASEQGRKLPPAPPPHTPPAPGPGYGYGQAPYPPPYPAPVPAPPNHSPGLALLLSFLFVGGGQVYNGQVGKGIGLFVASVVLWVVLLGWIVWLAAMADAYGEARKKQAELMALYHRQLGM